MKNYDTILLMTCQQFGISKEDVCGPSHARALVAVRREFVRRARINGASLPVMAKLLNRHHTTIMHLLYTEGIDTPPKKRCKTCGRRLPRGL